MSDEKKEVQPYEPEALDTHEMGGESLSIMNMPDDFEKRLANVDKAFQLIDKLKNYCLKRLSTNSITNEGGKPYIGENGVAIFDSPFCIYEKNLKGWTVKSNGIQIPIDDPAAFQGDLIAIKYEGVVGSLTLGVEATFEGGVYFGDSEAGKKDRAFHDKEDFLFFAKKAKANWRGRARRKLLGLDNVTWEDLEKAGIKKDSCQQVAYKKGSADASPEQQASEDKIRQEISRMLAEFLDDPESRSNHLEELTSFKGRDGKTVSGVRNPNKLSGKRLEITHDKVKKWHDELRKEWGGGDQNDNADTEN